MEAKTTNKRKRKELDRKEIKDEYSEIRKPYEVRIRSNGFGFTDNAKALFKTNSSLSKDMKKNTKYSKIVDIFNKYKIVTLTGNWYKIYSLQLYSTNTNYLYIFIRKLRFYRIFYYLRMSPSLFYYYIIKGDEVWN